MKFIFSKKKKNSQKNKKKAIWYADPVKMQDFSSKMYYFNPISMKDMKRGKPAPVLHFQKTDWLFLLSFLF